MTGWRIEDLPRVSELPFSGLLHKPFAAEELEALLPRSARRSGG